jgi:REP element-mobilizing transposase RayT
MQEKFKNQYRIESTRLENWDYSWPAWYFITIVTKEREHYFGKIVNQKMILSDLGKIVKSEWVKTPKIRPDMNLVLDKYIIMPNHFHGIIQIGRNAHNQSGGGHQTGCSRRDMIHRVSTVNSSSTAEDDQVKNQFGPQRKNLASIVRGFKSAVTETARKAGIEFNWQARFYDQIIRDKKSLYAIRKYIKENPENWNEDEMNYPS